MDIRSIVKGKVWQKDYEASLPVRSRVLIFHPYTGSRERENRK